MLSSDNCLIKPAENACELACIPEGLQGGCKLQQYLMSVEPTMMSWRAVPAGPSFPMKRRIEPASFANGLYRPTAYEPGPHDREELDSPGSPPAKRHVPCAPRAALGHDADADRSVPPSHEQ